MFKLTRGNKILIPFVIIVAILQYDIFKKLLILFVPSSANNYDNVNGNHTAEELQMLMPQHPVDLQQKQQDQSPLFDGNKAEKNDKSNVTSSLHSSSSLQQSPRQRQRQQRQQQQQQRGGNVEKDNNTSDVAATSPATMMATMEQDNNSFSRNKTLPYLIIHMGPDKTGTTSIQTFLMKNTDLLLSKDKYDPRMSRHTKDKNLNKVTSFIVGALIDSAQKPRQRAFSQFKKTKQKWDDSLQTIIDLSNNGMTNVIISIEELRWANFHTIDWDAFLKVMKQHFRVRVVLVYRRYFEWLLSRYNEEWKIKGPEGKKVMEWPGMDQNGNPNSGQFTPTFNEFYQWERNGTCVRQKLKCPIYFQHRYDFQQQQQQMTHPVLAMKYALESNNINKPDEIIIINFHSDNLLEEFFCVGLPTAQSTCQKAKTQSKFGKNPSMNEIDYDFIALAAYKQGLIQDGIARNFAKFRSRAHMLDELHQSIAELPLICLGGYNHNNISGGGIINNVDEKNDDGRHNNNGNDASLLLEEFRNVSYQAELILQPSMVHNHDEAFYKDVSNKKFCNVDGHELLKTNDHWREYMSSMKPG